eukprot:5340324-Prymnesium_polylepis.1
MVFVSRVCLNAFCNFSVLHEPSAQHRGTVAHVLAAPRGVSQLVERHKLEPDLLGGALLLLDGRAAHRRRL